MVKKPKKTRRKSRRVGIIRWASKKKAVKKPKKKARALKSKKIVKRVKPKKIAKKKTRKVKRIRKIKRIKPKKTRRKSRRVGTTRRARLHTKFAAGKKKKIRLRKKVKLAKPRVYIGKGALEQLFESQAKVKILKFFFRNSRELFQLKEIFKRLRTNPLILRHELTKLESAGLLKQKRAWLAIETKSGKIRKEKKLVYYLNPAFDFIHELKNLVLKSTIASKDDLVNSARKLGNIKILLLAGLFTGDDAARADLLIVGDKLNHRKLNNFIKDLEAEVGRELDCAIMSTKEFNYRYDMYDRFVRDLINGKSEILINRINLW